VPRCVEPAYKGEVVARLARYVHYRCSINR
jgi:hypothetical protein